MNQTLWEGTKQSRRAGAAALSTAMWFSLMVLRNCVGWRQLRILGRKSLFRHHVENNTIRRHECFVHFLSFWSLRANTSESIRRAIQLAFQKLLGVEAQLHARKNTSLASLRIFKFICFVFSELHCQMVASLMVKVNESNSLSSWEF